MRGKGWGAQMFRLPIMKAFETTFTVVFGNLLEIIKIVWLPLALMAAALTWIIVTSFDVLLRMPDQGSPLMARQSLLFLGEICLAFLIFLPMVRAGLHRFVIRGERAKGFFYLRFGADELRIVLTALITYLAIVLAAVGSVIALSLLQAVLQSIYPPAAPYSQVIVAIPAIIFSVWVVLRLSLSIPAAVGAEGIGTGPSLTATEGSTLKLLIYWFLWIIVFSFADAALGFVAGLAFSGIGTDIPKLNVHASPHQEFRALLDWLATIDYKRPQIIIGAVIVYLIWIVYEALRICTSGVAYKLLTEGDEA